MFFIGVLFYMRSNKSQMIEKAEERKAEVEKLPYDESVSRLSNLTLTGETKSTYDRLRFQVLLFAVF